jgi:hypothetical protein
MGSFVYLIGPEVGPLKIGISGRPADRAKQLQTAHPRRVSVFGSWHHDARAVELQAHNLLAPSKTRAVAAIEQAIATVDGDGQNGIWVPHTRPAILDTETEKLPIQYPPPIPEVEDEFRLGYARHAEAPGLSLDCQIAWLEASKVDPRDIWVETDRTTDAALELAIKDFREGDRFLVLSPDVIASPEWLARLVEAARKRGGTLQFATLT